jgi:multidrug efflux pump subunit AcrA (membrane-fusion protein)
MENNKGININSENVLGNMPGWISKYGIFLLILILGSLVYLSYIVKYPVSIETTVTVANNNRPKPIISRITGNLKFLNVSDGQIVSKNMPLAAIGGAADPEQIMRLKKDLFAYLDKVDLEYRYLNLRSFTNLGEIQPSYIEAVKAQDELKNFTEIKFHREKITNLEQQLEILSQLHENQLSRYDLLLQDVRLKQDEFDSDSILYTRSSISIEDYKRSLNRLLEVKNQLDLMLTNALSTELQIQQLKDAVQEKRNEGNTIKK